MELSSTEQKKNFSKYDPSGTDPNRYAAVSNTKEADSYLHKGKKSIIPGLRVNVGKTERILMIAAGSYLLYKALKRKDNKKLMEGITAGTMLTRGITGYCPAYDVIGRTNFLKGGNVSITTSLTINRPVGEVYDAWRKLENLPLFMEHIESVTEITDTVSEWSARVPGGIGKVSWKAEILTDKPNEILSWHSLPGSTIDNAGKVKFKDNGSSTDIDVTISYHAPLGKAGEATAKLFNPLFEGVVKRDIKQFKEYMETGE